MALNRPMVLGGIALLLFAVAGYVIGFRLGYWARMRPQLTIEDRLQQYGPAARERLRPRFAAAGVPYPPAGLTLVGLKRERRLEVWSRKDDRPALIHTYRISGMSGGAGPKLKEGDRQVPEGIYGIESLNPNSRYHLSLRVSYPNEQDQSRGREDGRESLGGDIMIHGGSASVGCLAMGDEAAEELFVLAADTGLQNLRVILAPCDFRKGETVEMEGMPKWTAELYERIKAELSKLR